MLGKAQVDKKIFPRGGNASAEELLGPPVVKRYVLPPEKRDSPEMRQRWEAKANELLTRAPPREATLLIPRQPGPKEERVNVWDLFPESLLVPFTAAAHARAGLAFAVAEEIGRSPWDILDAFPFAKVFGEESQALGREPDPLATGWGFQL